MAHNYSYHYSYDPKELYHISCGRFAQVVRERYRDANQNAIAWPGVVDDDPAEEEAEDEFGAPAPAPVPAAAPVSTGGPEALNNPVLWELVARCQWALRSDRELSLRGVTNLFNDLRDDGCWNDLRGAFQVLSAAITKAYPLLAAVPNPTLVQIIALGKDMATAVGQAPDLLEYIKNEQQPVNLATMLRI